MRIDSNGLTSIITKRDMPFDSRDNPAPLAKIFKTGDVIKAVVTKIMALENEKSNETGSEKKKKILNVNLSMRYDSI